VSARLKPVRSARPDYLTAAQHIAEAERLSWVLDDELLRT
jgi:hypothetical protein